MMQRPISLACRSAAALSLLLPALAIAAPDLGATQKQPLNWHAMPSLSQKSPMPCGRRAVDDGKEWYVS